MGALPIPGRAYFRMGAIERQRKTLAPSLKALVWVSLPWNLPALSLIYFG